MNIKSLVVNAVADATGFESDEIDLNQSLSEELGIDSIRRTEILASVCDAGGFDSSSLDMESLARAETVADVIKSVGTQLGKEFSSNNAGDGPISNNNIINDKFHQLGKEFSSNNAGDGPSSSNKTPTLAFSQKVQLPSPHELQLEHSSPVLIVSDLKNPLVKSLTSVLQSRKITTVRLDPKDYQVPTAETFKDIEHLSGCIHIHSTKSSHDDHHARVRYVLLLAKHVSSFLKKNSSKNSRSFFFNINCYDDADKSLENAQYGGLSGLCKSLDLEWDTVFCRHVDISLDLDLKLASECVVSELYDPNVNTREVSYDKSGTRSTCISRSFQFNSSSSLSACTKDDVWIVSGGGRGITPFCLKALSRRAQGGTFYLLGRSSKYDVEPEWVRNVGYF